MIEADDVEASARDLGGAVSAGRPRDRIEGSQHGAIGADGDGVVETKATDVSQAVVPLVRGVHARPVGEARIVRFSPRATNWPP